MSTVTSTATPTLDISGTSRVPFGRLITVELRKMADTRAGMWLLLSIGLITAAIVTIFYFAAPDEQRTFLNFMGATATPQGFLLPVLGILLVTQEWSQRTAMVTFTLEPSRMRVVTAKLVSLVIVSVLALVVGLVLGAVANVLYGSFSGDDLVLLDDQDRSLWDDRQIAAGRTVLDHAIALGGRGSYVLQAAIAALQTRERIDWPQVAALYRRLVDITGSPVVELNRAAAMAQAGDPGGALRAVDHLDLDGYLYFHSTRGELLRRLGRHDEARTAYRRALELATTTPERRFLTKQLEQF